MDQKEIRIISGILGIQETNVAATIALLEEGATVPFISRYRKERTGSLDEVQVEAISEQKNRIEDVLKRRETILKTIQEQELLTPALRKRIEDCYDLNELEDIYLPFKPKRRTKASIAREKGLEPLAELLMKQQVSDLERRAYSFINEQVKSVEEALAGARDIVAEWINEHEKARAIVRREFERNAVITCKLVKGKDEAAAKFHDYFDWNEPLKKCPSHRLLAMRRGENEGFLRVSVSPANDDAIDRLNRFFIHGKSACATHMELAINDCYKRLLEPSMETEFANLSKLKADEEAIRVFAGNLRQLLLAAPLGQKRVLALDPGYRTGCKVVCLDQQGNLLANDTIYPHSPQVETAKASQKILSLVNEFQIEAFAIGNGTASRETEQFIKKLPFGRNIPVYVVSEDGASIYSASKIARDEFPGHDVTVRGAVSIGRRLLDPLAELVKIDPKSIGVGQYQHDVDQKKLKSSLDRVVESCVNLVGVNVNTASQHLLVYISGLGPQLAQNIVDFRKENGPFKSRTELQKVPRMGAKAFEQAAGFLRIAGAANPLDNAAVHPESYFIVKKIAADLKCSIAELMAGKELQQQIVWQKYVGDQIGLPTLMDIKQELAKPGRDPRSELKEFEFAANVHSVEDLCVGMELPGIVTNITKFGAFVDVGVKQDGLVHVSQLANRYVSDPNEVVSLHQHLRVKVIELDLQRNRIQLSMKQVNQS